MRLMIIEGEEHMPGIAPWPFTVIFFFCDLWDLEAPFFNLLFYRCLVSLIIQNVARHAWQHRLAERDENGTGNGARAVTRAGSVDVFNVSHGHRTDTVQVSADLTVRVGGRRARDARGYSFRALSGTTFSSLSSLLLLWLFLALVLDLRLPLLQNMFIVSTGNVSFVSVRQIDIIYTI
jgi:hypothetical protein